MVSSLHRAVAPDAIRLRSYASELLANHVPITIPGEPRERPDDCSMPAFPSLILMLDGLEVQRNYEQLHSDLL
jgi:hypothetical protein